MLLAQVGALPRGRSKKLKAAAKHTSPWGEHNVVYGLFDLDKLAAGNNGTM